MSSDGCWAADQGSSSTHQSVHKRSTQTAKLSWDDVVPRLVPRWLLMVLVPVLSIFGFWLQEKVVQLPRPLRLLALVYMLALLLALAWNEHLLRNYMHMHNRVSREVVLLVKPLLVVTMVGMAGRMLSLWWQEVLLLEMAMMLLIINLHRVQMAVMLLIINLHRVQMAVMLLMINLHRVVNFRRVEKGLRRDRKKNKNYQHHESEYNEKWLRLLDTKHGLSSVKCGPHEWLLDSGAPFHCTSNLELLLERERFQEMENKDSPSSGDEAAASLVQRRGSVRTDRFDFPGVHYVTVGYTINLVSVSQLVHDHGVVVELDPMSCWIKEKKTGKIVGKGHLRNDHIYTLDYLRIPGKEHEKCVAGDRGASSGGEHGGGGSSKNEILQEMDDEKVYEDDNGKTHQEINGNVEDEDKKRGQGGGGSTFEESSNKASRGLLGLSRFVFVLCLGIAACISLLQCMSRGTGVICKLATFNNHDFHSLLGFSLLIISSLDMLQSSSRKLLTQMGWLSRFDDGTTGHRRYKLPIVAFPGCSTNAACLGDDEFILDSGASLHMTSNEMILPRYPKDLKAQTEPPGRSIGGISGSIKVERSGYLSFGKIKLDGVLLAPSRFNIVSVGQLVVQYNAKVIMDDKGFIIKRKQGRAIIGRGRMIDNHLYVLEYFEPGNDPFAVSPTPDFKIFGRRRPGRLEVNTDPSPAHSTTTEETVSPSGNQQEPTEKLSPRERRYRKRSRLQLS